MSDFYGVSFFDPRRSPAYPGKALNKEEYEKTEERKKNREIWNLNHGLFPSTYVGPISNRMTSSFGIISFSGADLRCMEFVKTFWRCASTCNKQDIGKRCFEELEDMNECKFGIKTKLRRELIRKEYARQTGMRFNPDVEKAPIHLYGKNRTGRPEKKDNTAS